MVAALGGRGVYLWGWIRQAPFVLQGHAGAVERIRLSPGGEWLAAATVEGTAHFWEVDSGRLLPLRQSGTPIHFSSDGRRLAALADCGFGEMVQMLRSLERAEKIENNEPERRFTERLARQHEILNRRRDATERPNVFALARGQIDPAAYPEINPAEDEG